MSRLSPSLLALLLLVTVAGTAIAVSPPRPYAGLGVLVLSPPRSTDDANLTLPLYRDPGIERIAILPPAKIAGLAPAVKPAGGEWLAAVSDKRGKWVKVVYDDAERSGWLAMERSWEFARWEEYLSGRSVTLLPGLKKVFSFLREQPRESSPALATATGMPLLVLGVSDDWCRAISPSGIVGWLRWRDGDRRFLVSVGGAASPQNR